MKYKNIFILTGAGISAESGLRTFREAAGLWNEYSVEDVASIEGYMRNPALVLNFYNSLKEDMKKAEPNVAHRAITKLQKNYDGKINIITQNVDLLHEKSENENILHMHGQIEQYVCLNCRKVWETEESVYISTPCPYCGIDKKLKPHIVFFGEIPLYMEQIERMLMDCNLFISIGTSGVVYPAAGFVRLAKHYGAETIEFTLDGTENALHFDKSVFGKAGETFPLFVEKLLNDE